MSGQPTEAQQRRWMAQWRSAAIALQQVRNHELRTVDLGRVAALLEDAFLESLRKEPARLFSGLITQQRLFHRRA